MKGPLPSLPLPDRLLAAYFRRGWRGFWLLMKLCGKKSLVQRSRHGATFILQPKEYNRWLERDSERGPVDVLRPFEAEAMAAAPCNPKVGNAKNNGPDMLTSA